MSMFDTLFIHKSLLEEVIKDTEITLECDEEGFYCNFQTKDLDNCLTPFYIQVDGSFSYKHQDQEWVEIDPEDRENSWRSGYMKEVGEPEMRPDNRSVYIDFYDIYYTEEERVYATFTAHIKDGKLSEPIKLKKLEKTNLEKEAIETKYMRNEWDEINSTWQWRFATFLFDFRNKVRRLFYPLFRGLDNLDYYLRKEAKKGTSLDENLHS